MINYIKLGLSLLLISIIAIQQYRISLVTNKLNLCQANVALEEYKINTIQQAQTEQNIKNKLKDQEDAKLQVKSLKRSNKIMALNAGTTCDDAMKLLTESAAIL